MAGSSDVRSDHGGLVPDEQHELDVLPGMIPGVVPATEHLALAERDMVQTVAFLDTLDGETRTIIQAEPLPGLLAQVARVAAHARQIRERTEAIVLRVGQL